MVVVVVVVVVVMVVGAVGKELPRLKIAHASAEREEKERGRKREGERPWQSNSVVVSASRIDLEPSPA